MSLNSPRPPRPPRPGGGRPGTRPAGPPRSSGIQPSADGATGKSDFGDTRTVILSRKNMGMHQRKKGDGTPATASPTAPAAAAAPVAPQLPKATVINNTVSCVKCAGSFPILGDEYYGAVVECPDCAAEFIIPTKAEVMALASAAPAPAPVAPAAPAPVAAAPPKVPAAKKSAPSSGAAPKTGAKKKTQVPKNEAKKAPAKKRKPVKRVPPFVEAELEGEEEVFACETQAGGAGGAILAAIMVLLTAGAGIAPIFLEDMDKNMKMAIPGVAGLVFAIIVFVMVKGSGGSKALVVTSNRVFAKAGKWFAQSDIEE